MRDIKISTWFIWGLTVFFAAYQFVLRLSPGALYDDIMVKFQIDATTFAIMSGAYYLGYAGMQLPIGILLDKFGVRIIVTTCLIICVIGNLPLIYSDSWLLVLGGRFLIGFGSAAAILGAIKIVRTNFDNDQISKMIGWTITVALLGGIYGKKINTLLIESFGWEKAMIYLTVPGLVIALLVFIFAKSENNSEEEIVKGSIFDALSAVVKNPQILLIAIAGAFLVGPFEAFADVWGSPFFVKVFGFSKDQADYLSAGAIYLGMCIGSPLLAWFADKYQCHYRINVTCGLAMAAICAAIIFKLTNNFYILFALNLMIGIFSAYQVIVFATVTNIIPANISGIALSYVNMINMGSGYAFHYGFGKILHLSWDGALNENLPNYLAKDYINAMYVLPITLLIGSLMFIAISPRSKENTSAIA